MVYRAVLETSGLDDVGRKERRKKKEKKEKDIKTVVLFFLMKPINKNSCSFTTLNSLQLSKCEIAL